MRAWVKSVAGALPPSWRLAAKRWYYPWMLRRFDPAQWPGAEIVRRLVSAGDVVVDAGANIGYVSVLLARWVGPEGTVYSFEPVPETFSLLCSNMRALKLPQVRECGVALSSCDGLGAMSVPAYAEGGENFYEARLTASAVGPRVVPVRRLDEMLREEPRPVRFMKIDVEGHELEVVRGSLSRLRRDHPALYIEMSGMPDEPGPGRALGELLASLGYAPHRLHRGRLQAWQPGERSVDLFFLSPAQRRSLDEPEKT
jgi:FkbM family methyltransferase